MRNFSFYRITNMELVTKLRKENPDGIILIQEEGEPYFYAKRDAYDGLRRFPDAYPVTSGRSSDIRRINSLEGTMVEITEPVDEIGDI